MTTLNSKIDLILKANPKAKRLSVEKFLRWQEHAVKINFSSSSISFRHGYSLQQVQDILEGSL